ncbi:MAG: hypothetical protein NTX13_02975 [Acidobacteria bacterium]|jgi:hypothetical protein|nr:hypothetical protein [Acidobacteriaceae bacterium]MCX6585529.1 hypothetical protein [Acidobacteriota bacterium]
MRGAWMVMLAAPMWGQPMGFLQGLENRFEQTAPRGNAPVSAAYRQERLRDVNAFNAWFDQQYLPAFQAQPGWTPQRRAFVGRASAYLGAVRGLAGNDAALGLALSGAFHRLGRMQEADQRYLDREGALHSYSNAALILSQLANENPDDPNVRGQLAFVGGRVNALGGSIPIWMSVPVGGQARAREQRGIPEAYRQAPVKTAAPTSGEYPRLDEATLTAEERAQWRELRERYYSVLATVYAAKNAVAPVQASVEGRGLALTPDLVRSSTRMSLSLDLAREYLEQKQFGEARENLQIADGEARKILRYVGL